MLFTFFQPQALVDPLGALGTIKSSNLQSRDSGSTIQVMELVPKNETTVFGRSISPCMTPCFSLNFRISLCIYKFR